MAAVLVIEDDDDLREAICQVLADDGIATARAGNGAEALALLESGLRPSLILLDLMMPVMNGWAFRARQEAEARWASIPVIVMTAASRLDDAAIAGADLVRKPVALDELIDKVRRHLADDEFANAPPTVRDAVVARALDVSDSSETKS